MNWWNVWNKFGPITKKSVQLFKNGNTTPISWKRIQTFHRLQITIPRYVQISTNLISPTCFFYPSRGRLRQEIDVLQNNLEFLSQRIETSGNTASTNQDNQQYAPTSATTNDNRYPTEYASSKPTPSNYSNYSTAAADNQNATTGIAQSYSRTSPNQSVARDDVNYEGILLFWAAHSNKVTTHQNHTFISISTPIGGFLRTVKMFRSYK